MLQFNKKIYKKTGTSHNASPVISADFSYQETPSILEFVKFNLSDDTGFRVVAKVSMPKKIVSVKWGGPDLDPQRFPYGEDFIY